MKFGYLIIYVKDVEASLKIAAPTTKPWGQTVSYVRCPDGTLVELCTPVNATESGS